MLEPHRRMFTVDEVFDMAEAGVFAEDERVELLDGELFVSRPPGPVHSSLVGHIARRVRAELGSGYWVREEKPGVAGRHGLPMPDLAVVHGSPRAWMQRHPRVDEATLLVEVSQSTLGYDRDKLPIYARHGAPEVWLVDVKGRRLEVHSEPDSAGRYRLTRVLDADDVVAVPGTSATLAVADLLP